VRFVGHIPKRMDNRGLSQESEDTDDTVFQGSDNSRGIAGTNWGTIFMEGDDTNVVEAVFNAPMAAVQVKNPWRVSFFGRQTGNSADGFFCYFAGLQGSKFSVDTEDLSDMRKGKVMV